MQVEPILEDPDSHNHVAATYETAVPPSHSVTLVSPSEPPCKAHDGITPSDSPYEHLLAIEETSEEACNDLSGTVAPPSDSVTLVSLSEPPCATSSETTPCDSIHECFLIVEGIVKETSSDSTVMAVPPPPAPCTGCIRWIPYVKPNMPPLYPRNAPRIVLNLPYQK